MIALSALFAVTCLMAALLLVIVDIVHGRTTPRALLALMFITLAVFTAIWW